MKKIGILIFIVAIAAGIILAKMFSFGSLPAVSMPSISFFEKVKGSGNVVTEKRNVSEFTKVDVGGVFNVEIVAGKEQSVEVEADDNLLPLIKTRIDGETLRIESEKRYSTRSRLTIRITTPNIERVDLSGASNAVISNIGNEELVLDLSGASRVKVSGKTGSLTLDMSGASKIDAGELSADKVSVDGSGASRATVNVSKDLIADLSGASKVRYMGSPSNVQKKTSGGSSVSQSE
ncbi:MAG: DUF2807 domain-containing protein [Aridibacter famidurans]|nr:DUF2807 domain-containing protein [Aridibacter famidurans]